MSSFCSTLCSDEVTHSTRSDNCFTRPILSDVADLYIVPSGDWECMVDFLCSNYLQQRREIDNQINKQTNK